METADIREATNPALDPFYGTPGAPEQIRLIDVLAEIYYTLGEEMTDVG